MTQVNREELTKKVKEMYREVSQNPEGEFHFEMGRGLAQRLGYLPEDLDKIPVEAIESFAGVGHHFDLADIKKSERVLDLGSGSGMDVFVAALKAGEVVGLDMTKEQLSKAEELSKKAGFKNVSLREGYMEELPFEDESFDVVISNGVINLSAEKAKVFQEISRVLRPGGRLAVSDIVTEKPLTEKIIANADLWAACIGGAEEENKYKSLIETTGMRVVKVRDNPQYQFLTKSAQWATKEFGVKSVSLLAQKI